MVHDRTDDVARVQPERNKLGELGFRYKYGVEEMCRDLWNWASKNPYGYGSTDNGH